MRDSAPPSSNDNEANSYGSALGGEPAPNRRQNKTLYDTLQAIIWFNLLVVSITPLVSLYGLLTTPWHFRTAMFCVSYHVFNMIG